MGNWFSEFYPLHIFIVRLKYPNKTSFSAIKLHKKTGQLNQPLFFNK